IVVAGAGTVIWRKADCPNVCSQPQIRDVGIIGASEPEVTAEACTLCRACVDVCKENAVLLEQPDAPPLIDFNKCLKCGKCIEACPTGTIVTKRKAYRIQLGGKLGRHPQLAEELPDMYGENEVVDILNRCLAYYKSRSKKGERFAEIYKGPEGLKLEPKKSDEKN
ncbi:4Fe-4S binding protein, partial [Thermodesulfobacteriota bacterium]